MDKQQDTEIDDENELQNQIDPTLEATATRKRTPTEKGLQYQIDLMDKMLTKAQKRLENQINVVSAAQESKYSQEHLINETMQLDKLFDSFMEHVAKRRALEESGSDTSHERLSTLVHELDVMIFETKSTTNKLLEQMISHDQQHTSVSQLSKSSKGSKDQLSECVLK